MANGQSDQLRHDSHARDAFSPCITLYIWLSRMLEAQHHNHTMQRFNTLPIVLRQRRRLLSGNIHLNADEPA